MTYDDWKTRAPDCDEFPCARCHQAQPDDGCGGLCGDCAEDARLEAMAELPAQAIRSRIEAMTPEQKERAVLRLLLFAFSDDDGNFDDAQAAELVANIKAAQP